MRYLLTALLTMALVAPFAWSRITRLPSDDTAGGGSGNIYWNQVFGATEASWPTALDCMRVTGGNGSSYLPCANIGDASTGGAMPYEGLVYIRQLSCAPFLPPEDWDGTDAFQNWGVYEAKGDDVAVAFARNQVGTAAVNFTASDSNLVTKTVTINAWTTLSDGVLQVGLVTDDSGAAASVFLSGFYCTLYGIEG